MKATKKANAKINLSLDITSVLPNGYHAIRSVMQSVDLYDTLTVCTGTPGIRLSCTREDIPCNEKNTAYRAAEYFYGETGQTPEAEIHIEKRIPSEAGLGGGSADAAAVLKILNEIYAYPLNEEKLLKIALKIGADVPFCLLGGTRLCLNFGEVMAKLPDICTHVLLVKPEKGVSTAGAYEKFDRSPLVPARDSDALLFYLQKGEPENALRFSGNVFESLAFLPEYADIKKALSDAGAFYCSVSGSGSAYFGLFHTKEAALEAEKTVKKKYPFTSVCKTVDRGISE